MVNFNDILSSLMSQHATPVTIVKSAEDNSDDDCSCHDSNLDQFKISVARHMIKNDGKARDSAEVKQILNSSNLEQVEAFLKDGGYCDQDLLKTYRMFVAQEPADKQDH